MAEHVFGAERSPSLYDQKRGVEYGELICPNDEDVLSECWLHLVKGQNLQNLFLKLKIQNETLPREYVFLSDFVGIEDSASSVCTSITNITREGFTSQSGVGNGLETIIDLETYDNGDLAMTGNGADIQVVGPDEYALARLKGFSVSPGSAVEVHIRPALFGISERALHGFDYLERKCVEPSVDKGSNNLAEGLTSRSYTLSNCLVSATLAEMNKK